MSNQRVSTHPRAIMAGTVGWSAIAAAMLWAPAAVAQASDQTEPDKAEEEVVVTGYAASIARALANKRSADVVSDGIAAEDIGKYPEQNIAESLQRVTGVQITRTLGEGQFLSVRGLDPKFTNTLYNGRQMPSASGTRAFDFQVLTSNFASRVDVYKSPTADLIESGLAATVNMQSIEPLSIGKRKIVVSAEGNYDQQLDGGIDPHIAALYTDTFMDGKLGVSVAVDWNDRAFNSQNFSSDGVTPDGTYAGPGTQYRIFGIHQNDLIGSNRRRSATGAIQFKPTDNFEIKLDSIYSWLSQKYDMSQGNNWYTGAGALGPSPTDTSTVDGDGVQTAWRGTNVFSWVQANRYEFEQETHSTALSTKLKLGDWALLGELSYGRATELATQTFVSWATRSPGASLYYDTTVDPGGPISFGFYNGFNPFDTSNYYFFGVQGPYKEPTADKIWNGKIDVARNFERGWLRAVKFGINVQDRTLDTKPNNMTNSTVGLPADMTPYLTVNRNPNFFAGYSGPAEFPRTFLTVDLNKLFADYPLEKLVALNPPQQALTRTTSIRERSQAGYVRFDLASDNDLFRANVGVRAVRTEQASSGYIPAPGSSLVYGLFGGPTSLSYSSADVLAQEHAYTYVLPSLNARYQIGNDLLVRFAAARVMQRPDMNLLGQASSPNATSLPPAGTTWRGTLVRGNPDLKPYISDQLDLSFEWYFGTQNMLGAAVFLKEVKNLVLTNYFDQTANVTLYPSNTQREIILSVAQPVNAESSTIKGLEVGYQHSLTFLPGFLSKTGIRANWTHIWYGSVVLNQGSPAVPLTGISSDTYNLGAYYDDGKFSVHAGYNYRSRWVQDPLSFFGDGIFTEGYGQLDFAANYRISENFSVNAWLINATESALRQTNRYGITRLYELSGRRFTVGARASF